MKKNHAYTLIELLAVVSVISILAAMFIVKWDPAKESGDDGKIISNLTEVRIKMEFCRNDSLTKSYNGCESETATQELIQEADSLNGDKALNLYNNGTDYCLEAQLNSGQWYCVDSSMVSKEYDSDPSCSSSNYACESGGPTSP